MNAPAAQGTLEKEKKIFYGTAARILKLLGVGCTPVEAADACGVDPSYVSQLEADDDFVEQKNAIIRKTFEQQSKIDENYVAIEAKLSERLLGATEMMFNPDQILRTLKFANEAKRKVAPTASAGGPNGSNGNGGVTVFAPVTLILPASVAKEFILNPIGEVVSVDGKPLTTLPSGNMTQLVKQQKEQKKLQDKRDNGSRQTDPYSDL